MLSLGLPACIIRGRNPDDTVLRSVGNQYCLIVRHTEFAISPCNLNKTSSCILSTNPMLILPQS